MTFVLRLNWLLCWLLWVHLWLLLLMAGCWLLLGLRCLMLMFGCWLLRSRSLGYRLAGRLNRVAFVSLTFSTLVLHWSRVVNLFSFRVHSGLMRVSSRMCFGSGRNSLFLGSAG